MRVADSALIDTPECRSHARRFPVTRCRKMEPIVRWGQAGRLAKNGPAGSGIEFGVIGYGQRLPFTPGPNAAELDMTATL